MLLSLAEGADPAADREDQIREALGEDASHVLRRVVVVPDEEMVTGPTGKVRKFLMRQRLVAGV